MVDQNLVNYIWTYLQQGYDAQTIRSTLLGQGYSHSQVEEAFNAVYQSNYHGDVQQNKAKGQLSFHITKTEIIAACFLLMGLAVIGTIGYVYFMPADPEVTDPIVNYRPPQTNNTHKPAEQSEFETPNNYQPPQDTRPPVTQPTQSLAPTQKTLSRLEIDELVTKMAQTDPQTAITYCPQILTVNGENSCYSKIAIAAKDPKYCQYVTGDTENSTIRQRDFCYMQFAIQGIGGPSICAEIKNFYRKESCLQLVQLQQQVEVAQAELASPPAAAPDEGIGDPFADESAVGDQTVA